MNEKQKIEFATTTGFLELYNSEHGTSYAIDKLGDSPDVVCVDGDGNRIGIEITLTEDKQGDIKAILGRSDHLSMEKFNPRAMASQLQGNVTDSILNRLRNKLQKKYGVGTALVIRHASGVDWDWDAQIPEIRKQLAVVENHYDKGIWLMNLQMSRLFKIL